MDHTPIWAKFIATKFAPVDNIKKYFPLVLADSSECECSIQIGIFFDGTGNNEKIDAPKFSHSNIVRLSRKYKQQNQCFRFYIPGLGTEFKAIGEEEETVFGSAFGVGGDTRVFYAILAVFNAFSLALKGQSAFSGEEITAICSSGAISKKDKRLLENLGIGKRIIDFKYEERVVIFKNFLARIKDVDSERRYTKINEACIDVFGFSRGAAEARVFCKWLNDLAEQSKIVDIPLRFRFLGLFDTVASAGVLNGIWNFVSGNTDGHGDWALAENLRVLPQVENCVHFIAMHEQRKNFPLDTVAIGDAAIPSNCQEYVYPGTHSDIGGGYAPEDLGIGGGDSLASADGKKLSQITLNHMYQCAIAAGVPLQELPIKSNLNAYDDFTICPKLRDDFSKFIDHCTSSPKLLSEWVLPYIHWRWKNRENYEKLEHVKKASKEHKKFLIDGNKKFFYDGKRMANHGDENLSRLYVSNSRKNKDFNANANYGEYRQHDVSYLEPEAVRIHEQVSIELNAIEIPEIVEEFFDLYLHDSVAGFRASVVEPTGHWKFRRLFRGYDSPRLSHSDKNEKTGDVA